jgi:hypothetical protein
MRGHLGFLDRKGDSASGKGTRKDDIPVSTEEEYPSLPRSRPSGRRPDARGRAGWYRHAGASERRFNRPVRGSKAKEEKRGLVLPLPRARAPGLQASAPGGAGRRDAIYRVRPLWPLPQPREGRLIVATRRKPKRSEDLAMAGPWNEAARDPFLFFLLCRWSPIGAIACDQCGVRNAECGVNGRKHRRRLCRRWKGAQGPETPPPPGRCYSAK